MISGRRRAAEKEQTQNMSRDRLISQYLPHVKRIVHRIAMHLPPSVEIEELENVGVIGLIQAFERYDPSRQNKFITYAEFRIKGAVLSELRSRDFLSRSNRRKFREMERAYMKLEQQHGQAPEDEAVAKELGVSLEDLFKVKTLSSISFVSFEDIGYNSREEKDKLLSCLVNSDFSAGADDALTMTRLKEIQQAVADSIDALPEKEKLVISLYYWDELTMKEIGKVMSITESRVSQIHSQSVLRLRRKLIKKGLIDIK